MLVLLFITVKSALSVVALWDASDSSWRRDDDLLSIMAVLLLTTVDTTPEKLLGWFTFVYPTLFDDIKEIRVKLCLLVVQDGLILVCSEESTVTTQLPVVEKDNRIKSIPYILLENDSIDKEAGSPEFLPNLLRPLDLSHLKAIINKFAKKYIETRKFGNVSSECFMPAANDLLGSERDCWRSQKDCVVMRWKLFRFELWIVSWCKHLLVEFNGLEKSKNFRVNDDCPFSLLSIKETLDILPSLCGHVKPRVVLSSLSSAAVVTTDSIWTDLVPAKV